MPALKIPWGEKPEVVREEPANAAPMNLGPCVTERPSAVETLVAKVIHLESRKKIYRNQIKYRIKVYSLAGILCDSIATTSQAIIPVQISFMLIE